MKKVQSNDHFGKYFLSFKKLSNDKAHMSVTDHNQIDLEKKRQIRGKDKQNTSRKAKKDKKNTLEKTKKGQIDTTRKTDKNTR